MAHAYTPGLKVCKSTTLQRERKLPLKGEVTVKKGEVVKAEDVVAKTSLPGNVHPLNVAGFLGISPSELPYLMLKKPGEKIRKGEIIAESKGFFGLFKTKVSSPIDGQIESFSSVTGQAILSEPPIPIEVIAYIDGEVVDVFPEQGVLIKTEASFIQGIFGIGGECIGTISVLVQNPEEELAPETLSDNIKGKIIVGGSFVRAETVKKAIEKGAVAVVCGGIDDENLKKILGYDIGVAITGSEDKGITLIITEGFGRLRMAGRTFELFKELEGKKASCNGATQIRAGVIRPEVIVPHNQKIETTEETSVAEGMDIGTVVRIIREPYFGIIGKVASLPPELRNISTEAKVRVVEVQLENGQKVLVPRANVEIIEE